MPLISLSQKLFGSPGQCNKLDLDVILGIEYQLFTSLDKFRYLRKEDLLQEFLIEGFAVNVPFLENKAREITVGVYSLSTVEIVNSVQQIGAGFLLVARNCILGLF